MMTKKEIFEAMAVNLGDDMDLLNEIFQDYLGTANSILNESEGLLTAGDCEALRRSAHTLKGCSANVGAEDIRAAAYEWELAAKAADLQKLREFHGKLKDMVAALA